MRKARPRATMKIGNRHIVFTPPYKRRRYKPSWPNRLRKILEANREINSAMKYMMKIMSEKTKMKLRIIFGKDITVLKGKYNRKTDKLEELLNLSSEFLEMPTKQAEQLAEETSEEIRKELMEVSWGTLKSVMPEAQLFRHEFKNMVNGVKDLPLLAYERKVQLAEQK